MSLSLVPESFELVERSTDPDFGMPMAIVARRKVDFEERVTVWKLVRHENGWYNAGFFTSTKNCFIPDREGRRKGLKLSTSRLDNILRDFAIYGESNLL
jgi:hypothetical protein